jgi:hypothetical protein
LTVVQSPTVPFAGLYFRLSSFAFPLRLCAFAVRI